MIRVAFVVGDYPPEQRRRREDVAMSYASAEIEVGIVSVAARPFDGLGPAEIQAAAPLFHDAFRRAEREGYDAVVPLGMLDLGVDGGRSAVDIPVVAPLQAALHVAALVGERFGVVCYHPSAIPRHRAQTLAYGMESFIAGRAPALLSAAHRRQPRPDGGVVPPGGARARRAGRRRCHHRAGHHPMPGRDEAAMADGRARVPVVEGIGAPIKVAAMLVALGLKQSRVRWPQKARSRGERAPALEHFQENACPAEAGVDTSFRSKMRQCKMLERFPCPVPVKPL